MSDLDDFSDPQKVLHLVMYDVLRDYGTAEMSDIPPHMCFVLLTPISTSRSARTTIALARKPSISLAKYEVLDWVPYSQFMKDSLMDADADYLIGIYFGFVQTIKKKHSYVGIFTTPFGDYPKGCKIVLDKSKKEPILLDDPKSQFLFLNTPLEFDSAVRH